MKSSLRSRQEPRRVSNGVIIGAMLLSLCVLSFVKARYCATPLGKAEDQLEEQMNANIRMQPEESSPARTPGEEEDEQEAEEENGVTNPPPPPPPPAVTANRGSKKKKGKGKPTCYMTSKRSERCDASGDIRVDGNRSTIYVRGIEREWRTKPYARYHDPVAMAHVREYTLKAVPEPGAAAAAPACTRNHTVVSVSSAQRGEEKNRDAWRRRIV